jgi:VWFA-related protein
VKTSLLIACLLLALPAQALAQDEDEALSIRITSPLGRTGVAGTIRIVAQVAGPVGTAPIHVRFFIDGTLLAEDTDGPPYATEWIDENPFERREIAAEAVCLSTAVRSAIVLEPYEIVDEAQVISVLLEVAVLTEKGRFVTGLGLDDFTVEENGAAQALQLVRQEDIAATFALLVDSSQSMGHRIDFVRRSAERLLRFVRPADRMIVAPFSYGLRALTGPTDDRVTVSEAIGAIRPGGGTAILDALAEVATHLDSAEGRRAVILITDGYDENSRISMNETMQALLSRQITVYVVAIGGVAGISLQGERLLRQIAEQTGGRAFFPSRETELGAVYDVLATDAQNRYLISYTPENQLLDGSWREVSLRAASDEYVVRTRKGYFAPAPPPIRPAIEFTVTDTEQRYVDVTADDLILVEDEVEQQIDSFQEAVTPVSVVLALDASGSMRRSAEDVKEAAREFVGALRPQDSLAVVMFADTSVFAHDLSTNRKSSLDAIDQYVASGGTALYDGVSDSVLRLAKVEGRRVVVVLSDGRDEDNPGTGPGSVRSFETIVAQARESGATIFPIGFGPNVDRPRLDHLAEITGGHAYYPSDVASLRADYARIVENLRRRFVLRYNSTNPARNGAWRSVEIRLRSSNLVAASAGGYFAPER